MGSRSLLVSETPDSEAATPKQRSYLIGNWTCFLQYTDTLRSTNLKTWRFNLQFSPEYVLRNFKECKFIAWMELLSQVQRRTKPQ
jgi:hypothetical protein